jgi:hypothetical protein
LCPLFDGRFIERMKDRLYSESEGEAPLREHAASSPALSEKQRRELWLYIAVSLVAVELLVGVGSLLYGFINGGQEPGRAFTFSFPWLYFGITAVLAPALVLLLVHLADVGLFRKPEGAASEAEWQKLLPLRMQKLYRIIKGAPVVVVLLGIIAVGAGVLTLDGALSALARFASSLAPHVPYIAGGIAGLAAVLVIAVVWLHYRTRKLIAEYEFRREVLEKTGVIIVDKGSIPLPPGGVGNAPYAVEAGDPLDFSNLPALPAGGKSSSSPDPG